MRAEPGAIAHLDAAGGAALLQHGNIGPIVQMIAADEVGVGGHQNVFPDADLKLYLDASPEERARRRASDPAHTGVPAAVSEVATLLTQRDEIDRTRTVSPLYAAADAIVVDTTGKDAGAVVDEVLALIKALPDP